MKARIRPRVNRAELPAVMDLREVGEVLGFTPDAVRQLIKRGDLRAGRLGRRLFVRREWLLVALDAAAAAAAAAEAAQGEGGSSQEEGGSSPEPGAPRSSRRTS